MGKKKRVTLNDIAEDADCSQKSVSQYVNNHRISVALGQRIEESIRKLGYERPRGRVSWIGLVTPRSGHPFYGEFLEVARQELAGTYYELVLKPTGGRPVEEADAVVDLLDRVGVDGLILVSPTMNETQIRTIAQRGRPMVLVNMELDQLPPNVATFVVDNASGVQKAVEHLSALQHRRIGFISGPLRSPTSRMRQQTYTELLKSSGDFSENFVYRPPEDETSYLEIGFQGCRHLVRRAGDNPTALICADDFIATGALRFLDSEGVRVPDDMSVVGFDNVRLSNYTNPPLTTVTVPNVYRSQQAINALLSMMAIGHDNTPGKSTILPVTLEVRKSTGVSRDPDLPLGSPRSEI